jgi:aminoglycoside 6'-N-acetyltransferase I
MAVDGGLAELADADGSKSSDRKVMGVQFPRPLPSQSGRMTVLIRSAQPSDLDALARMCHELWPDASAAEHRADLAPVLAGTPRGTLPQIILVAEHDSVIVGFIDAGLRSHADGCDTSTPVGFIEGWFVDAAFRLQGVGARLVKAAEDWARTQGCAEMASDTWIDHDDSQRAHAALGFEEVDRCVHYRKKL